jgi:hypothetical protein
MSFQLPAVACRFKRVSFPCSIIFLPGTATRYLAGVIRNHQSISESPKLQDGQDCLRVTLEYIFGAESIFLTVSVALASESCPVAHLPSLPRVGLRMVLPSSFSKMTWLGQGAFWGRRGLLEAVEDGHCQTRHSDGYFLYFKIF